MILFVKTQSVYLHLKDTEGKTIGNYTEVTQQVSKNKKIKFLVSVGLDFKSSDLTKLPKLISDRFWLYDVYV